jgi:methyl-accepting chemotaxis protein
MGNVDESLWEVSRVITFKLIKRSIWGVLRRSDGPVPGTRSAATVSRIIQELETLNRSTERDFLVVGEKLMEFRSTARQISADMAAVIELISGEQERHASQTLIGMLDHSKEIDERMRNGGQAFASISEHATRLRRAFAGLSNMVAVFRSLCTLTRIEASRLGGEGADLGHLAAEVRPLSESIQSTGEGVLEASHRLDQEIQTAIQSGSELRKKQVTEMPALISGVTQGLQSLEERRRLALESSDRQAAQYSEVSAAIDDLVGSLQLHDITRQQVEHVVGALRQLRSQWGGAGGSSSALNSGTVLTLQSSQLAGAARTFAESIERIQRDLESIAGRLVNASDAVRSLMGMSGDDHDSFFVKMEGQFTAILKVLCGCSAAQAQMDSTAAGLDKTIDRMRGSVTQIRGTEIQIQRISTNATIRAIHIGAPGVALNKIAEVMQHLALDSNTNTEEAAAALEAMSEAAGRVAGAAQESTGAQSKTHQVTEDMRRALTELHTSSQSSFERVHRIAELSTRLAQDIGALRGEISAGRMFAEIAGRAQAELEDIGAQAGGGLVDEAARQHLETIALTYTMQSQRDVHESVVSGVSTPVAVAVAPPVQNPEPAQGDLGDNVDLF